MYLSEARIAADHSELMRGCVGSSSKATRNPLCEGHSSRHFSAGIGLAAAIAEGASSPTRQVRRASVSDSFGRSPIVTESTIG
jgi:hypothetical protein